jgi:ribonuclease HI
MDGYYSYLGREYTDIPEGSDPLVYFRREVNAQGKSRWVRGDTVLVYTKGDAGGNGRSNTQAGSGVAYIPPGQGRVARLPQESNSYDNSTFRRAELEAAIAAARHPWRREGYSRVVIATDSKYIFTGTNEWIYYWQSNGWLTINRTPVKHRDLWQQLWQVINDNHAETSVQFYLIRRYQNRATALAKQGMVSAIIFSESQ